MTHQLYPAREQSTDIEVTGPKAQRHVEAGDPVVTGPGHMARVLGGVLLLKTAAHRDAPERVIGLLGPGDFLIPHPADNCHIACAAYTDARLELWPALEAAVSEVFRRAMTDRVQRADAWTGARGHRDAPYRVRCILDLIATQFSVPHDNGRRLTLYMPHRLLADLAVTSETVAARELRAMISDGLIEAIGEGENERLCLSY